MPDTVHWLVMAAQAGCEDTCDCAVSIVKAVVTKQQAQLQQRLIGCFAAAVHKLNEDHKSTALPNLMVGMVDKLAMDILPSLQQA
jgi:hypothetical protein